MRILLLHTSFTFICKYYKTIGYIPFQICIQHKNLQAINWWQIHYDFFYMLQSNNDNGTGYLIDSKLFKLYERGNCSVIYSLISQKKCMNGFTWPY